MFQLVNPVASCFGCPGIGSPNCCVTSYGPNGCFTSYNPISFGGMNGQCGPCFVPSNFVPQFSGSWCGLPTGSFGPTAATFCPPMPFGATWPCGVPGSFSSPYANWTGGMNWSNSGNWTNGCNPVSGIFANGIVGNPVGFNSCVGFGGVVNGTPVNQFCGPTGFGGTAGQVNSATFTGGNIGSSYVPGPFGSTCVSFNPFTGAPTYSYASTPASFVNGGINGAAGCAPIGLHREAA